MELVKVAAKRPVHITDTSVLWEKPTFYIIFFDGYNNMIFYI